MSDDSKTGSAVETPISASYLRGAAVKVCKENRCNLPFSPFFWSQASAQIGSRRRRREAKKKSAFKRERLNYDSVCLCVCPSVCESRNMGEMPKLFYLPRF